MKDQRYNVGDKVTYRNRDTLPNGKYQFGGGNQSGYVGIIKCYGEFVEEHDCYCMYVTHKDPSSKGYTMLEKEFEEWDHIPDPYSGFKIGDMVVTRRFEANIGPSFVPEMVKACGRVGTITDMYEHDNVCGVRVHGWIWPVESVSRPLERVESLKELTDHYMGPEPTPGADVTPPKQWLLAQARSKYLKGTQYIPVSASGIAYERRITVPVIRAPEFRGTDKIDAGYGYIYAQGVWAEIVPTEPVIAQAEVLRNWAAATPMKLMDAKVLFFGSPEPNPIHRESTTKRIQL